MNGLRQMNVGISGAVPSPSELQKYDNCELEIHWTLRRIVERILAEGGNIVYGSHPTFTPIIESIASRLPGTNQVKRVRMFAARRFFDEDSPWESFSSRHSAYALVEPIAGVNTNRELALTELREKMIHSADALVCIGGRLYTDNPNIKPGVQQEVDIALGRKIPIYLVGICGGYTRHLYEDEFASQGHLLRNQLSQKENENLALSADIWEAVNLVLEGLARVHSNPG